ncbi:hypothetical protein V502_00968 [Pseudogymnoascus sp. VKM F-4520 (FW-2644)]|nr:hypothetical protein V502_00968 [Pseudogymnoascus sp. VKM F-4520 (FW-2644)]
MSFGFSVGDFIAAIELANKIWKEFVDAPSLFKAISDEVDLIWQVSMKAGIANGLHCRSGLCHAKLKTEMIDSELDLIRCASSSSVQDLLRKAPLAQLMGQTQESELDLLPVDTALPGKHTQQLYNQCTWKEATVLAQLRTGIARLNSYLVLIKAAPSDQCDCGEARETVEHFLFRCKRWTGHRKEMLQHFLFRCKKWTEHRKEMLQCTETHRSNISFYLGGKSLSDDKNWTPDMKAVRTTIRFAIATGRLDADPWQGNSQ